MARKTYKKVIVTPELLEQVNPKDGSNVFGYRGKRQGVG